MSRWRHSTPEGLRDLLGVEESETLDFKRELWSDGEEAAKDVAAMANAQGGEILVGIDEDPGTACAARFVALVEGAGPEKEAQRVRQWLKHRLRPRDFVDQVELRWLVAPSGTAVLAVRVPAAARGCMAVARDDQRKGSRFRFPVRTGRDTRDMEYDEVLQRMTDTSRAMRLQLEALCSSAPLKTRVQFASPFRFVDAGGPRLMLRAEESGSDGEIAEIRPSSFSVRLVAHYHTGVSKGRVDNLVGREVEVPYPLVRALWASPSGAVKIALNGYIDYWPGAGRLEVSTG